MRSCRDRKRGAAGNPSAGTSTVQRWTGRKRAIQRGARERAGGTKGGRKRTEIYNPKENHVPIIRRLHMQE